MEYKEEQLVCQYGSQFNWFKYICSSNDESRANIKAFINDNEEISFGTFREIEIGEEFLYTFGEEHRRNEQKSEKRQNGMYSQIKTVLINQLGAVY